MNLDDTIVAIATPPGRGGIGVVRIAGRRQLALTAHYINSFFDVYLKGAPAEELDSLPGLYPELKIGITTAFPQQQTAK